MKINLLLFSIIIGTTLLAASCSHDSTSIDNLPEVSFSNDVLPIFQTGCAISGCHDESTAKEGEIYTNYENIIKSVKPGNPENSKSYKAMTNYFQIMPPQKALSVEDRTKIKVWISQGANNN